MATVNFFLLPDKGLDWFQHQIYARKFGYSETKGCASMIYITLRSSECAVLLRTVIFADEYFRNGVLSSGDRNTWA